MWKKSKIELKQNSNQFRQRGMYLTHIPENSGMANPGTSVTLSSLLLDNLIALIFHSVMLEKR